MAANTLAYGFTSLEASMAERVTTVGVGKVVDAIRESAQMHTDALNALMASWVERNVGNLNNVAKERYYLPGTGTLQPLDQWGNPLPVKEAGYYDVGYPIQGGGTAWGDNRVSRAMMTVDYANRRTVEALKRDADWLKRHLMASVLDSASWTFSDPEQGNLSVLPLANGDAVTYNTVGGASATDTHYLAQAAAIDNTHNPFDTLYNELAEHPSNRGPFVAYIATSLKTSVTGLSAFIEKNEPAVSYGSGSDTLTGIVDPGIGDETLGYVKGSNTWVVEWKSLPTDYMIVQARGAGPFVYMREYPVAPLQGFFPETFSPDGNIQEMRMIRYAGFGVRNRVAALAYYVGNASYVNPTAYDAPLAV